MELTLILATPLLSVTPVYFLPLIVIVTVAFEIVLFSLSIKVTEIAFAPLSVAIFKFSIGLIDEGFLMITGFL